MAEELLKLQDFSAALTTLNKANQQLDALSQQLVTRQESLKPLPPDPEPAQQPDEGTATEPQSDQEAVETDKETSAPGNEPAAKTETATADGGLQTTPPTAGGTATKQQ